MKANKILKRIAKIEALIAKLTERSSESVPHIRELLGDAKAAVTRAKMAVTLQVSSGTAKNPAVKDSEPTSKATPESSNPKRKLSAAGRKAIVAATKKRWAAFHAAAKQAENAERAVAKRTARKKTAPTTAAKKAVKKAAPKVPMQKAAPKKSFPAKTKRPMKAAKRAAPVTAQPTVAAAAPTPEVVGVSSLP
jgi:hypothetical protein